MICKYCKEEQTSPVVHLVECHAAPVEARAAAQTVLADRDAYLAKETCCRLRKKVLLKPVVLPEELCGVPDSELLDVMTFEKFQGIDVVCPRYCSWCGAKWKQPKGGD